MNKINPLDEIEPIDLSKFLNKTDGYLKECQKVVQHFHDYGLILIKSSKVRADQNREYLNLLEKYFDKPDNIKMEDAHPELLYQVGSTPAFKNKVLSRCDDIAKFDKEDKPLTLCPPEFDPKWRFFWPIGPKPEQTMYKSLQSDPVIPEDFPSWKFVMNDWGEKMLDITFTIAKMAAIGFGLPEDYFVEKLNFGPHLLAPTASNLKKYGLKNTVLAHLHKDLNFLTLHGKANYPGLFVWLRNKKKAFVKVPENCFLAQAGLQFEHLTGGKVYAGLHEVVVCDETIDVLCKRETEGKCLWRVSSTFFSYVANDKYLETLDGFPKDEYRFPKIKAGDFVLSILQKTIFVDN